MGLKTFEYNSYIFLAKKPYLAYFGPKPGVKTGNFTNFNEKLPLNSA